MLASCRIIVEYSMLKRIADLILGAACRAATLVADDDYRLVLTPRFGGLILPAGRLGLVRAHADR
jgi:hypothetical protein